MSWQEQAACVGVDPELFFSFTGDASFTDQEIRDVSRVCRGCPVRAECLEAHLGDQFAFAGGMTPRQRQMLARQGTADV